MILFFMVIIPVIYYLLISYLSSLYHSLYNKIGDLELKIIDLEYKLNNEKKD